jgi:N utilization substance protein B
MKGQAPGMENITPRRKAREEAFLTAFSVTFQQEDPESALQAYRENQDADPQGSVSDAAFTQRLLQDLLAHQDEIDAMITAHLKGWTLARLPRVSLAAMRIALAEMLYGEEKKPAVAINEAVELVKKYGAEKDYQFVNGLLGAIARGTPGAEDGKASEPTC